MENNGTLMELITDYTGAETNWMVLPLPQKSERPLFLQRLHIPCKNAAYRSWSCNNKQKHDHLALPTGALSGDL